MNENNAQDIPNGTELYPDDCTGWLWITSPGTASEIAKAAQIVKFFWIDDVWITGYIAKHLNIEHQVNQEGHHHHNIDQLLLNATVSDKQMLNH